MKNSTKKITKIAIVTLFALAMMVVPTTKINASVTCKSLCAAALKETKGANKLKYSSASTMDFGGLSYSVRKKVTEIQYVCDAKEVYSLGVMKTKNAKDAKSVLVAMQKYIKNNKKSDYLSDYTKAEQKVFKNAICGSKGNYVWYISMSTKKADNTRGQKKIAKTL